VASREPCWYQEGLGGIHLLLDFGLSGKRALVAGGGRGIGRASALALAEAGARVACVDVDDGRTRAVAAEISAAGGDAFAVVADLRRRDEAERAIATTADAFGGLDVLVDVIGEARWGRLLEQSDEDWEASFDAVLRHAVFLSRAAARRMIDQGTGGAIVSIASVSGLFAAPLHGPYGAAKAALIAFTRTLAVELGAERIRVNTVAPGAVLTPRVIDATTPERREVTASGAASLQDG
jgi:3-oxoacyl-[acyl-carrier protein] reductase